MTTEDLSWEDRNHLHNLCVIPILVTFFVFLIYFNYLMYTDPVDTRWEIITLIVPFFISLVIVGMISYEILYHRMVKKPLRFHLKRFTGRMFLALVSGLWFFGMLIIMQPVLSPLVGDRDFLVSSVLSVIIFAIVVVRFRKTVYKLDNGEW